MKLLKTNKPVSHILSPWLLFLITPLCFFILVIFNTSAQIIEVSAIVPGCGDGIIEEDEQCDISNFNGKSCATYNYNHGALICTLSCDDISTANCSTVVEPTNGGNNNGGGGGGGGGGNGNNTIPPPATNVVIFTGMAYPKSTVTLLKDAQVVATTIAGPDANFQISILSLSSGNYIFSLYSEDYKGVRSALLTFPVDITSGVTTKISNIFITPSIGVDKSEVKKGDNIAIFGQSAPLASIVISVHSDEEVFAKTISNDDGVYLYNFDTAMLEDGTHYAKSKASVNNSLISGYGLAISFKVGLSTILKEIEQAPPKGDLNNDEKVNIVDFSIAAYWYKRPLSDAAKLFESNFLNNDGKIDLVDFSILAYYWTG